MVKARIVALVSAATLALAGSGQATAASALPPAASATALGPWKQATGLVFPTVVSVGLSLPADAPTLTNASFSRREFATCALADARQELPRTSAAPLPGALWLFGSALLVFLGISARRSL